MLRKKYKVKINMYINDYVSFQEPIMLNDKSVMKENIKINPDGLKVVESILSKTGLAGRFNALKWKKEFLIDVNSVENKHYDTNMGFDEFLEVLNREKVVTIEEIDEPEKSTSFKPF